MRFEGVECLDLLKIIFLNRIKNIHHLPGENMEAKNLRACIELDFDILP